MSASAILCANADNSAILLDLPRSIELAQQLDHQLPHGRLLSCSPPQKPYPSTEPKTESKRQKLIATVSLPDRMYHEHVQTLIQDALDNLRSSYSGPWCLDRHVSQHSRTLLTVGSGFNAGTKNRDDIHLPEIRPPVILSGCRNDFRCRENIENALVLNGLTVKTKLYISSDVFTVPPQATFLMSDVLSTSTLFSHFAPLLQNQGGRRQDAAFNLIVADPPWPNRSVRRSKAYTTSEYQHDDPFDAIRLLLRAHLTIDGLVAIWITNKGSVRRHVQVTLQAHGLDLMEEWIWIKVTTSGEPVTELDGLWRHPYEVCLIFRRPSSSWKPHPIQYRVIAAVPDLHSRKPSLKEVVERFFPGLERNRGLEIFARYPTAGWWSWGNEVLHYANEAAWTGSLTENGAGGVDGGAE